MRFDRIWLNARLATLAGDGLGIVEHGAVAAKDGRIAFAGPRGGPAGRLGCRPSGSIARAAGSRPA